MRGNHKLVCVGNGSRQVKHQEKTDTPNEFGGTTRTWRTIVDGQEAYSWRAEVDLTMLEHMAAQAAKNKSGRSRDGALLVTITERKPIE